MQALRRPLSPPTAFPETGAPHAEVSGNASGRRVRGGLRRAGTERRHGGADGSGDCCATRVPPAALPDKQRSRRAEWRLSGDRRARRPRFRKPERPTRRFPETHQGSACEAVSGEPERSEVRRSGRITRGRSIPAFPWRADPSTSGAGRSEAARSWRHGRAWTGAESGKPPRTVPGIRRGTSRITGTAKQAASFPGFRGRERPGPCRKRRAAERRTAERTEVKSSCGTRVPLAALPDKQRSRQAEWRLSGDR